MKIITLLLACLPLFPAVSVGANAPTLTVSNGSLGLAITISATNHVWANPPLTNTVFDRWIGNTNVLADPYEKWWSDVQPLLVNENVTNVPKINPMKELYWK